jgi:threonine/homoserine/homoserine lactone efflux protein
MSWTDLAALTAVATGSCAAVQTVAETVGPGAGGYAAVGRGVLLGLGAAMPLGPVNVEIARRVLWGGFGRGVALGLGAVTVDVVYALASTLSFVQLDDRPWVARTVGAVGVCFLTYLGVQCLRAARAAWRQDPLADADSGGPAATDERPPASRRGTSGRSAYLTGLLMTLLNPMTLVFWFTAVPAAGGTTSPPGRPPAAVADVQTPVTQPGADAGQPVADALGPVTAVVGPVAHAGPNDLPMMGAGVFIGTTAWVFAFSGLLAAAAARAGARRPQRRRAWLAAADAAGGVTLLGFAAVAFLRLFRSLS